MLAYDIEGAGQPVVFLHGLTFDRRSWRPVVERLDGKVTSVAVDLPAHGDSGGEPEPVPGVAARVHSLVAELGLRRPIVVGHSLAAGMALMYGASYPAAGVVVVDQGSEVQPFAETLHRVAPMLRGPGFDQAWSRFEESIGLDRVPEPTRSAVSAGRRVRQDLVLGYQHQLLTTEPADLQSWIDGRLAGFDVPCLAVFGRPATPGERERFARMPDVEIEEWLGDGHCVHLVEPDRFAQRLLRFVDRCTAD